MRLAPATTRPASPAAVSTAREGGAIPDTVCWSRGAALFFYLFLPRACSFSSSRTMVVRLLCPAAAAWLATPVAAAPRSAVRAAWGGVAARDGVWWPPRR